MATQSVSLGQNSYLYSATEGTTHIKVLEDIVEIVTRDSGDKKLHGWESVGVVFNRTINFYGSNKSNVHSSLNVDAAYFLRAKNADGSYKHCAIIAFEGNKLGMLHYPNGFSSDYNNGAYIASSSVYIRYYVFEHIGTIDDHLIVPNDKFDVFLFVNPKWLAFAVSSYSEEPYNHKSTGSFGIVECFGLIGIFEVEQSMQGIKSVVANFGMLGYGTYIWKSSGVYGTTGIIHDGDYLDTTTFPLIYSCPSGSVASYGNDVDLYDYAKELPKNVITGIDIYKGAALGAAPPVKYGTLAGIKLVSSNYSTKPLSFLNVRCDENLDLDYNGNLIKHFCVPTYCQYSWDFYGTKGSTRNYINTVIPA